MNTAVPRPRSVPFCDRRPTGAEQHRYVGPESVHDPTNCVSSSRNSVYHDHLRPSGHHGVAVSHAHGCNFMGYGYGPGQRLFLGHPFSVRLDDGGKIGAAVAKEIFNATGGQQFKIGFRHAAYTSSLSSLE